MTDESKLTDTIDIPLEDAAETTETVETEKNKSESTNEKHRADRSEAPVAIKTNFFEYTLNSTKRIKSVLSSGPCKF